MRKYQYGFTVISFTSQCATTSDPANSFRSLAMMVCIQQRNQKCSTVRIARITKLKTTSQNDASPCAILLSHRALALWPRVESAAKPQMCASQQPTMQQAQNAFLREHKQRHSKHERTYLSSLLFFSFCKIYFRI